MWASLPPLNLPKPIATSRTFDLPSYGVRSLNKTKATWSPFRKTLMLVLVMGVMVSFFARSEARRKRSVVYRLRVMTFNIRHSRGQDEIHSLARIARIIRKNRVDLVALQEVDVGTKRVGGLDQVKELGRLTRMHAVFGQAIEFQGGRFGNAILSRFPIVSQENKQVSGKEGAEERRVLEVKVRLPHRYMLRRYRRRFRRVSKHRGPLVTFWGTHWDYASSQVRVRSAERVNAWSKNIRGPLVMVGDLNAEPDSEPLKVLAQAWSKVGKHKIYKTIPTRAPRKQLDYILLRQSRHLWSRSVRVLRSRDARMASDHRPFLADLRIRVPLSYLR